MSADNVAAFKGSGDKAAISIGFSEPPDNDPDSEQPSSLRVWQALTAVCRAAESVASDEPDPDAFVGLATAAAILSGILENRLIVAPPTQAVGP